MVKRSISSRAKFSFGSAPCPSWRRARSACRVGGDRPGSSCRSRRAECAKSWFWPYMYEGNRTFDTAVGKWPCEEEGQLLAQRVGRCHHAGEPPVVRAPSGPSRPRARRAGQRVRRLQLQVVGRRRRERREGDASAPGSGCESPPPVRRPSPSSPGRAPLPAPPWWRRSRRAEQQRAGIGARAHRPCAGGPPGCGGVQRRSWVFMPVGHACGHVATLWPRCEEPVGNS